MKFRRRILSALLAAAMVLAALPLAASAAWTTDNFKKVNTYRNGQFNDVASGEWYSAGVRSAYELGLMRGVGDSRFNLDGAVTLAEAVTLAARLHSVYYNGSEDFRQSGVWYSVYVEYARRMGILTQDYANYEAAATRAQFAYLLARAFPPSGLAKINDIADGAIPDVSASHANAREIYLLYRAGVLTGSDASLTFRPNSSIQRSEAAAIVARMALPDQRVKIETAPDYTWQGDDALDFTAQLTDGSSFTLSDHVGKVVLVNFWATWCGPCVRELPDIARLYEEYSSGDEVVIVTVNAGESAGTVERYMSQQRYSFPVICDIRGSISYAYGVNAIPRTVIFNRDGTVAADYTGARTYEVFHSAIESALGG